MIFRPLPDGAVLLHTTSEVYFGLNEVGARIWALLPPDASDLDELCARLALDYSDVPSHVLRADVVELLDDLRAGGLVTGAPALSYAAAPSSSAA